MSTDDPTPDEAAADDAVADDPTPDDAVADEAQIESAMADEPPVESLTADPSSPRSSWLPVVAPETESDALWVICGVISKPSQREVGSEPAPRSWEQGILVG